MKWFFVLRLTALIAALAFLPATVNGTILWSYVGTTLAHDTGPGKDILGGTVRRDNSSDDVLYFKFHVNPISDFHTERYLAGLQLFENSAERLGVGNAWNAWSYSAFNTAEAGNREQIPGEFCLRSTQGTTPAPGGHFWEVPVRDIERTIVFKVQYVPGSNALVTVWLNPNLGSGATENGQDANLTTHFTANAAFNEIHLCHTGGGGGWIFSDMAIATSFEDFVNAFKTEQAGTDLDFRCWHREQGLIRESVSALTQSPKGYLWIGTDGGVARFDGVRFVSFGLQEGLPASPVTSLLEDHAEILWIGTSGNGLARMQNGKITTLTKQDGLPGNNITSLAEDGHGKLWIGTDAGLAVCQDGRVYSVPDEFKNKSITALFADRHGTLWVGVKGIGIYQRVGNDFTLSGSGAEQELLKDSHCLLVDRQGRLWVGAGDDCILCRDGAEWIQHRIARHLARPYVTALAEGADGTIWAGSMGEGLVAFQKDGSQIVDAGSGLSDNSVESILCDARGNLWVGTKYGLNELKRRQLFALNSADGLGYGAVEGMTEVSPGVIWIGKADDGLYRWDGTNVSLVPYKFPQGYQHIQAILSARDGSCWVAGAQGLWHGGPHLFPTMADAYNVNGFYEDGKTFSASLDTSGHLYSGNLLGAVVKWNGLNFKLGPSNSPNAVSEVQFSLAPGRYSTLNLLATGVNNNQESQVFTVYYTDGTASVFTQNLSNWREPQNYDGESVAVTMPYRNVSDGTRQDRNYYLFGYSFALNTNKTVSSLLLPTNRNVVVFAAVLSPEIKSEFVDSSSLIQLPGHVVNALCENSKGEIWAGTQAGELWQCRDQRWTIQTNFISPIISLLQGKDESLWIGTEGAGLFRLKNGSCTHFGKANGLLSESIRSLYFDQRGALWIGTGGGGLSRLQNGNIATITTREGLPDNTISQILEDDIGRLWLGTDHGIAAVTRNDLEQCADGKITSVNAQLYGQRDGMPSEECTGGFFPAGLKTSSGLLCFSTQRGLFVVDPHSQNHPTSAPAAVIEEIAVDGTMQPVQSTSAGGAATSQLHLSSGTHQVAFRYTGLNFDEPERVHFRYQLEGLDRGWIEAGTERVGLYNYVPPGNYRFRVMASGTDGVWRESDFKLPIVLPQYLWKRWWFISPLSVGALVAMIILIRFFEKRRHRRHLQQLERERALDRERTRIARDLHDEMGSKLSLISYLSKTITRADGQPNELQNQLNAISKTSREVLQNLDEIVWAVDPKNDTLEKLVAYIAETAAEYFEMTNIECKVEIPASLPALMVSSHVRHHLFSVVQEALTNTLKHSQATRTTIQMNCAPDVFEIAISDNGHGFELSRDDKPGNREYRNGLRNMSQRMTEIGGQCVVQSEPGRGTSLRLSIPLSDTH